MTEQKKTTPATKAKPAAAQPAAKPPRKLVPRVAEKLAAQAGPAVQTPATAAATATQAPAKALARVSQVDETVAKHQKVLAEALEQAQAIQYDKPQAPAKPLKASKPGKRNKPGKAEKSKADKPRKTKLVRDSYAMPEAEYAQIAVLKKRLAGLGGEVKKSELLRGGIALLAALNDAELKAVMGRVERIKTGRPAK